MTNEPKANLDPEMLAAYIDQRLSPDERAIVEAQLAADPDSYHVLVEVMKAQDALGAGMSGAAAGSNLIAARPSWRRPLSVRWVPPTAAVLALAAALVLVARLQPDLWRGLRGGEAADPQVAMLVAAVGDERYIEPRLTGGFRFGPLRPVTRGSADGSPGHGRLLAAAGGAQQAAAEDPSAGNLHAWGVAQLLLGEHDGAVASLERAAAMATKREAVDADLSAAYLARATAQDRADDLPLALAAADRALAASPDRAEALFNRALALESLHRSDEARAAWDAVLKLDPSSPWAGEARRHRDALPAPPPGAA